MKNITKSAVLLLFSLLSLSLFAQTDQETAMKAWQEYMTPGDMHKMLANADGEWDCEITMWMKPDADPVKSTGTCVNKMILGGRYQQSDFSGDFMGNPMEGMGILGYDNAKKIFISTWVDNMGTGIMKLEGPWDDQTKTMTLTGKELDPMQGKEIEMKETVTWVDENTQKMEMFMVTNGQPVKTMEILFKRK